MLKLISFLFFILFFFQSFGQQKLDKLTVEKIMRDPNWIGTSPSNIQWSDDGKSIYFNWNPENALADSLYYITLTNAISKMNLNFSATLVFLEWKS